MFLRTLAGLSLSIRIGLLTAGVSAVVALLLGVAAATLGPRVDGCISWCIDLVMGIPHILLVMLISIACGRGFVGVVTGVALSHWTSLARLVRGEILQLRQAPYMLAAENWAFPVFGKPDCTCCPIFCRNFSQPGTAVSACDSA